MSDQYFLGLLERVESGFKHINETIDRWRYNCAHNTMSEWNLEEEKKEIIKLVSALESYVSAMSEAIKIIESNNIKIDPREIQARKNYEKDYRIKIEEFKEVLASTPAQIFEEFRLEEARNRDLERNNRAENLISMKTDEVELHERRQGEYIDAVHDYVKQIGVNAISINQELKSQQETLEQIDIDIEHTAGSLENVGQKLGKLTEKMSGNSGWLCVAISILILFLISILSVSL